MLIRLIFATKYRTRRHWSEGYLRCTVHSTVACKAASRPWQPST